MTSDNSDLGLEKARTDLAREIEGLDLSTPPIPATVPVQLEQQENISEISETQKASEIPDAHNAAQQETVAPAEPYALPDPINDLVRFNRLASEQRTYERKLAAFENRRTEYQAEHGHSPDAWVSLYEKARDAHTAAARDLSVVEDRAEQAYRAEHVAAAQRRNTAYQAMEQANMFTKRAATRDYEQARQHYQATYGTAPTGHVPAKHNIAAVREQALKQDNPDLTKARTIEHNAGQKLAEIKARQPRWITEDRRPKPPTVGTPAQEAAKDQAYVGRVAQAKRVRNEYRLDVRAASSKHPSQTNQHGRGPER